MEIKALLSLELHVQLEKTAREAGWTNKDFEKMATDPLSCQQMLASLRGYVSPDHKIDLIRLPYEPKRLILKSHIPGAEVFHWNPEMIQIVSLPSSTKTKETVEQMLKPLFSEYLVGCANILDYLLHHPTLVTHEMHEFMDKGGVILFPTTTYTKNNILTSRTMYKKENKLKHDSIWTITRQEHNTLGVFTVKRE